jgi:hypothetical protein
VSPEAPHVIDIRTYVLRRGMGKAFHTIVHEGSVPMLRREGIEVVAYGPSLDDEDRYFLIRSFSSLEVRPASHPATDRRQRAGRVPY